MRARGRGGPGALAALLLVSALAGRAAAGPITFTAPASCGSLDDAIAADLGRPVTDGDRVRGDVTVRGDGGEYRATLSLETPDGASTREVHAADCAAVVAAAALVITLAVQDAAAEVASPAVPSAPDVPRSPSPPHEELVIPFVLPPPPRLVIELRAAPDALAAILPGATVGVTGAVAVSRAAVELDLGAATYLATRATASMSDGAADLSLTSLRVRSCGRIRDFRACGGGDVGWMTGQGVGLLDARAATRRWSAVAAGGRWRHRLAGPLAFVAEAEVLVGIERPRFVLDDGSLLFQPAILGVHLALGLEVRLH
jgi:hypothetical protein